MARFTPTEGRGITPPKPVETSIPEPGTPSPNTSVSEKNELDQQGLRALQRELRPESMHSRIALPSSAHQSQFAASYPEAQEQRSGPGNSFIRPEFRYLLDIDRISVVEAFLDNPALRGTRPGEPLVVWGRKVGSPMSLYDRAGIAQKTEQQINEGRLKPAPGSYVFIPPTYETQAAIRGCVRDSLRFLGAETDEINVAAGRNGNDLVSMEKLEKRLMKAVKDQDELV